MPKVPYNKEESSFNIACHRVGYLYSNQGKFREAEDMYVEGWVEDLGADGDNCRVLPKEEGGSEL